MLSAVPHACFPPGRHRFLLPSRFFLPELSEVEFGLIIASHAFNRWMVRCMACAGLPELTSLDILVLNHVFHRGRGKKLADICFTLNVEDTHLVNYSLKKLERLGVVRGVKTGKEVIYSTTDEGAAAIRRYAEVREQCLVKPYIDSPRGRGQPSAGQHPTRAFRPVRPGRARRHLAVRFHVV